MQKRKFDSIYFDDTNTINVCDETHYNNFAKILSQFLINLATLFVRSAVRFIFTNTFELEVEKASQSEIRKNNPCSFLYFVHLLLGHSLCRAGHFSSLRTVIDYNLE